ncbi:MAG: hypothetical protein ACRC8A_13290 [Microcoleaceae cyanobacterium]
MLLSYPQNYKEVIQSTGLLSPVDLTKPPGKNIEIANWNSLINAQLTKFTPIDDIKILGVKVKIETLLATYRLSSLKVCQPRDWDSDLLSPEQNSFKEATYRANYPIGEGYAVRMIAYQRVASGDLQQIGSMDLYNEKMENHRNLMILLSDGQVGLQAYDSSLWFSLGNWPPNFLGDENNYLIIKGSYSYTAEVSVEKKYKFTSEARQHEVSKQYQTNIMYRSDNRVAFLITNNSDYPVYFGYDPFVTAQSGIEIKPRERFLSSQSLDDFLATVPYALFDSIYVVGSRDQTQKITTLDWRIPNQ